MRYRRSLYIVEDMKAGDRLTRDNLKAIRPGFGLPTKYFDILIGKRLNQDVSKGTPVSWDIV
ncbi:MAG: pseudaminic acid synthase, partial [Clostridiales bacterium]|nr:pseudaminic acid synthase [Clostridiales bacterium]